MARLFRTFVTGRSFRRSARFSLLVASMVALLAVEAAAAAIKVRNGVPNAALFARRNVTGNQYFFCLGDSPSTPKY